MNEVILLVNFGGPRFVNEIEPFLKALLTDKDVVRSRLPQFFHNIFFNRVAQKRAACIIHDYEKIGGKSPIFEDTEAIAAKLESQLNASVLTFHRYLPQTHPQFLKKINQLEADKITVFPFFPQFTYATTGSIARFFYKNLSDKIVNKMHWIQSYPEYPGYITLVQSDIRRFLNSYQILEKEIVLLFSVHGLPIKFVEEGDIYQQECERSFNKVIEAFPHALCKLSYQSKFGRGEWLKPYTQETCENISKWSEGRKQVVIYPLSFTSDHIETLFEIEYQYLPLIRSVGFQAHRIPAFNQSKEWVNVIASIIKESDTMHNHRLIRGKSRICSSV